MKKQNTLLGVLGIVVLLSSLACTSEKKPHANNDFYVAAYFWPACHDEPSSREVIWDKGIGEWEIIQKGDPRFEGHYQPRIPLWGYEMDDDIAVTEKKIAAAADHGVNVFIYDWYWYDGKPFLEESLNSFLKAGNRDRMQFYLMWANHDVEANRWNRYRYEKDTVIWKGGVDRTQFNNVVERVINNYFKQPNYLKINSEPVFSFYDMNELVKGLGSYSETKQALDYFRQEVIKAGFPGLHIQVIGYGDKNEPYLISSNLCENKTINEVIADLSINSVTQYNWVLNTAVREDYIDWAERANRLTEKWDHTLNIPVVPHVSIGWDSSPRFSFKKKQDIIHLNRTPDSFAAYLQKAKGFVTARPNQPQFITINSWNEWTEGSYLEPDTQWGYGYLEAVQKIMSGKYDKYQEVK
jgi:hypothetical protein